MNAECALWYRDRIASARVPGRTPSIWSRGSELVLKDGVVVSRDGRIV